MIKCENDGSSYGIQGALRVRSVVLFQASYHRGHPALMELHGELGRRHLTFWSSAQAISQQKRALQSIVFDAVDFFSSSLADVALWLGPYMSISGKTSLCTRTKTVWKCRQITTTTTTHNPARRPANPPARLAFRQEKQQTRQTKGAGAQTKTTTKKICQRTQWFDHCIILKNMRK